MFKSARWRSDRNKIKAVFRLQFHATQVSLSGGDSLMITVIPADVGKPTAKLEKVNINDGGCYWERPVHETVKFTLDPKTGKINERLYHFVIATASSKFGILGEVSFDFAKYAGATKVSTVSLPLKTAKFEAMLHVSIERIQDSVDQREVGGEILKHGSHDQSLRTQLSTSDIDENAKTDLAQDGSSEKIITHVSDLKGNHRASIESDVTISSSDSISSPKLFQEYGMKSNCVNEDHTNFISSQGHASLLQKPTPDASTAIYEEQQRLQSDWSGGSAPDVSTDDSSNSPRETLIIREKSQDAPDILIEKLKNDLAVLARQSEVSELELQTLRKNIVKESKRGQDLSREIISLKEERDCFREECERLKDLHKRAEAARVRKKMQVDGGDPWGLLEELKQELSHEKDLNANLRIQLQKTQESNSELILAVRDLDEMLEAKNSEIIDLSNKSVKGEYADSSHITNSKCDADVDEDQKALEDLVKDHSNAKDAYELEQKVMDLCSELEIYRRDKDDLEMQMEQLSLDYEILKQENHDMSYKLEQSQLQEQLKMQYECSTSYATVNDLEAQIESLESELQKQSKEFSESLITINELENHVKSLEEELEKQAQGFEADLEVLMRAKVEQEKRAIRAEETVSKVQRQNVNTAERLQKELKRLYMQLLSTYDVNDKLATKALTEVNELRLEKQYLEKLLQEAKEELQSHKDLYEAKLLELSNQLDFKIKQVDQMQAECGYKSNEIERQRKHAIETHRILSEEISELQSRIGKLAQENSFFSEKEEQNVTIRLELEQMKVSTNNLSEEIRLLKSQIGTLAEENKVFSVQEEQIQTLNTELEQMKASIEETEILVLRGITETDELEQNGVLLKQELEKLQRELSTIRSVKDETDSTAENFQSEVETLKTRCHELKNFVLEVELEKQILRKQVIQLTDDVKMREALLSTLEKKMEADNSQALVIEADEDKMAKSVPAYVSTEDVNLIEKIRFLEGQLKLKEVSVETFSDTFLMKENGLQRKIDESERSLHMLHKNAASFCGYKIQKIAGDTEDLTLNDDITEVVTTAKDIGVTESISKENGCPMALTKRLNLISSLRQQVEAYNPHVHLRINNDISSKNKLTNSRTYFSLSGDQENLGELPGEMALLKAKNQSMEGELKDMQERYSAISLKFAEVEGERQKLIMKLRSIKNLKKSLS